jgi:hypothetical protein
MSRHVDLMAGATWRDPDRVEEWITDLTPDKPVAVYCSYGFDVGRNVTKTLIERGFDARFVRGGIAAWYASGGARAPDRPRISSEHFEPRRVYNGCCFVVGPVPPARRCERAAVERHIVASLHGDRFRDGLRLRAILTEDDDAGIVVFHRQPVDSRAG